MSKPVNAVLDGLACSNEADGRTLMDYLRIRLRREIMSNRTFCAKFRMIFKVYR